MDMIKVKVQGMTDEETERCSSDMLVILHMPKTSFSLIYLFFCPSRIP